ncbi:MAG: lamin tail domain-containing protein, partial [Candidatus Pacebacteria bacterium]|nr:lamin tail domain-containing protein [Candidatus Paceibacterota bacterium]
DVCSSDLELYNDSQRPITINDWVLKTTDEKIKIDLQGIVPGQGFFLLERSADGGAPNIKTDLAYQGALNNNGEKLQLLDGQNEIIDEVDCLTQWPAGDNKTKQTMSRLGQTWCNSQNPGGTPRAINDCAIETLATKLKLPTTSTVGASQPIVTTGEIKNIFINEVLPNPDGPDTENEWIETYNANGFEVNLADWKIKDNVGSIRTYVFPKDAIMPAYGFLVLMRPQTQISLQNAGDGLELLNPQGEVVDRTNYPKAPDNQSWNKTEDGWQWSLALTPGKPNIAKKITPQEDSPQNSAKKPPLTANISQGQDNAWANQNKTATPNPRPTLNFILGLLVAAASTATVLIIKKRTAHDLIG